MSRSAVVDTGPLVAFLNRRDPYHEWAYEVLSGVALPLRTCAAVLTETCFLVRSIRGCREAVLELVASGRIALPFSLEGEARAVRKLVQKYADVPMSLADACLVRMAERDGRAAVITLDRDFFHYRKHGHQAIDVVTPHRS